MRALPFSAWPLLVVSAAQAAEPPPAGGGLALWEIGAFAVGVSQQAYPGSDQQVQRDLALPYWVYRGERLRADRDTAGVRALRTPRYEVDIGFAGSFGANSEDIDARRGMRELGTLVEFGPRLKIRLGDATQRDGWRLELPVRGVFDLSDGLAQRGIAFEPELVYERRVTGSWRYQASLGAIAGNTRLARTFYGVAAPEATPWRPAYEAESGLIAWRLSASFSRNLGPDWRVFGFARLDSVGGAANAASPLVRQNTGSTVGLGLAYTWQRSSARAAD